MNELEKYLKSLQAKGFLGSDVTLDQFKNMVSGRNAKSFFDQVSGLEDSSVENQSLLTDELKDYDTYLEYFDIDTSFEVDDTKIEPLQSPYPEVDASRIPMRDWGVSEDEQNEEITEAGDTYNLQKLEQNYLKAKTKFEDEKLYGWENKVKHLTADYNKEKAILETAHNEKQGLVNLSPYKGTETSNPTQLVKIPEYDKTLDLTALAMGKGQVHKKIGTTTTKEGIHSWLFPELTTSYLAGILGKGDNDVRNANDLWKRAGEWDAIDKEENLLKNLVQVQYPGYKINKTKNPTFEDFKTTDFKFENPEIKTDASGFWSSRWMNMNGERVKVQGEEVEVIAPNGETMNIFTKIGAHQNYVGSGTISDEVENAAINEFILNQKIKLAEFVNVNGGIDLTKIKEGKSNLLAQTGQILNTPVNVSDPSKGGIAPNLEQAEDLLSVGSYNEKGEFIANPEAFSNYNTLVVDYIVQTDPVNKGGLTPEMIENPNTPEARKKILEWGQNFRDNYDPDQDKMITAKYGQWLKWGGKDRWVEKGEQYPQSIDKFGVVRNNPYRGEETQLPMVKTRAYELHEDLVTKGKTSATWNAQTPIYEEGITNLSEALYAISGASGVTGDGEVNPYRAGPQQVYGPGSIIWDKTEKTLQKAYEGTGLTVPQDLIKSTVAQQEYNKMYDEIRHTNLSEYLWGSDNDNYAQQLGQYYNVTLRDKNTTESMALMAINEADLIEFSGDNPNNILIDLFEETYNDPTGEFPVEEGQQVVPLRNGKKVNKNTYDTYIKARTTKENQLKSMLETRRKIWGLQDEKEDLDTNLHLLGKEYDAWNSSLDALGLGFADIGTGALYLVGKAIKYASPIAPFYYAGAAGAAIDGEDNFMSNFWNSWDDVWADKYDDYAKWKTEVKDQYGEEGTFRANKYGQGGAFTSATHFGRFVGMEVSKQIPILATMIASGGTAAPWVIGAYSAGQHWAEADVQDLFAQKQRNEFVQGISAVGYGTAEGVFEALTTVPILKRGAALMQRSGAKSMLSYKNAMKQYFKENAKHIASDPILEASAEFMTSITQNAIDGRPLMENADHAAFVGGMFGFGMSTGPFLAGAVARQFTDYNSFAEFQKKEEEIEHQQRALDYLAKDGTLSEEALAVQTEALEELKADQIQFVQNKFNAIQETMGSPAYNKFMETTRKQALAAKAANEILDVGKIDGLNKNEVNKLLTGLKSQFDANGFAADVYKNNGNFSNQFSLLETTDKSRYDRLWQQARKKLSDKNKGKVRDDQIPQVAEELYIGELVDENYKKVSNARKSKKKKYFKFDTNGEALTYIDDVLETSKEKILSDNSLTEVEQKKQIDDLEKSVRGFKDGIHSGSAMGLIAGGGLSGWNLMFDKRGVLTTNSDAVVRNEILGFRENAIKNGETQIFTHEASHAEFGEILGYDSEAFTPLAEDITKYLKATHPDIWEAIVVRRGGNIAADEVVMNFLEYVGKGDIDLNNKPGGLMGGAFGFNLNSIFKKNKKSGVEFDGANDTIKYLYNLGKAVSEGRVNRKMISEYRKKAVFKGMRDNYNKAKRRAEKEAKKAKEAKGIKDLQKSLKDFKFSDTKEYDSAADILKELNELVASNKIKPVKNYKNRIKKLTERFQQLKKESGVVDKVPEFKGKIEDESNDARKDRVNLIERSFRGRLESFQGGKPIQEILKAYEHKIETLFKKGGYFATDSYQRFESFGEALNEFTALVNVELMKSIRAFDPAKNDDFDAYIMSPTILTNKVKLANKKIGAESKNQGFNVGLEAASGVAVSENTAIHEVESTLRELLGVKKTDPFYGAAMTAVQDVMQEGLPKFEYTQRKKKGKGETVTLAQVKKTMASNPTGEVKRQAERDLAGIYQNVKSNLEGRYQTALDKAIKKEFLNTKNYDSFLKNHRAKLMRMLDISNLVALERLVKGDKILTKVVKKDLNPKEVLKYEGSGNLKTATTTQGPTLYSRLNPSEKAWVDFFNVRGRKDALAKILSAHLGLDATMQNLTSEKVVNDIAGKNLEIKEQLGEQALRDFAAAIKRGTSFKFSLAETAGMEGKIGEDYKALQSALIDAIIKNGVTDRTSVKLAVDQVLADSKFKPYRTHVKKLFEKLLKPYRKAISQEGNVEIDLLDYIQSVEFNLETETIARKWKTDPASTLFSNETITNAQKKAMNRVADVMLEINNGDVLETATQFFRHQAMFQNGTKVNTLDARGMLYGDVSQMIDEFFIPNFGIVKSETVGRGKDRIRTFEMINGDVFSHPDPAMPVQEVKTFMIDGSISKKELDYREEMAKKAWDFSVNIYKAAKSLYDQGGFSNTNMAMLMTGMGAGMQGPIRAAAPFRYSPVNLENASLTTRLVEGIYSHPLTEVRKGTGTFKDGVFTTKDAALARRIVDSIDMRFTDSYIDGVSTIDFTRDASRTTKNRVSNPWKEASDYNRKSIKKIIKEQTSKNFEYEHGIPAKAINLMIVDAIFNPDSKIDLKKLQESYAVGAVPVDMNTNMSTFFGERMQFGYQIGDIAPQRWFNRFTRGGANYAMKDMRAGGEIYGQAEAKLWSSIQEANKLNKFSLSNNVVGMEELNLNENEVLDYARTIDEALRVARDPNAPVKKIRVFDFDDTLARTKSNVLYTLPDGTNGKLTAEQFAKEGNTLEDLGAKFDFSEFNKVVDGKPGPLLDVAKKIQDARGTDDVFVLTARAMDAAPAIKEFLDAIGLNIPIDNITGLGNSSPFAKSKWVIEKAAEGYNDFYFADDHTSNVKAVQDALDVIDVKSNVQQAKFKFSNNLNEDFNNIIEHALGIESYKEFSKAKAKVRGIENQRVRIHPFSAEDFKGLMYPLLGKGKKGDAAYKWFDDHLFKPFARAMSDMASAKVNMMNDFRKLKKDLNVPKTLKKKNHTGFTNENAVRTYIWTAMGYDIPGLSKTDLKELNDIIENDPILKVFAEQVIKVNKGQYIKPDTSWLAGTLTTDLIEGLNKIKRPEYLSQWKENVDLIFSEKNMNKLEAALGAKYVEALRNSLSRMESGSNRLYSNSRLANKALDYLNNAQGVVMFLNMRSALLQAISNVNFLNWSFNNPAKAGAAISNIPQYSKDFVKLMNSDYLVARRGGLAMDINENEVALAAETAKNKAKAIVSYIIEKGYTPTKFMDSFAIASGGATFYRNRIKDLMKKNPDMTEKEAEAQAYEEFMEISEENQQSSRPDKISSQQASTLGRLTLNWANTQMQYVRIQKKAMQDIANGRGDTKSNVSKILYYGVIQNLLFQAAHAAVFALGFGDDDDDPKFKEDKIIHTVNGMADTILRGLGIGGHIFSVLKNYGLKVHKELSKEKGRVDVTNASWELIKISPVIYSKISRIKQAAYNFDSKKRRQSMLDMGFDIDNPAYDAAAKVISATTNIPLDRLLLKMDNVQLALAEDTDTWMRIALLLGWPEWQLKAKKMKELIWGQAAGGNETDSNWGKAKGGYKTTEKWGEAVTP